MLSHEIAVSLLEIKAVTVVDVNNLFTWVSGIKSPVYCDNRMTIGYPKIRKKIAHGFESIIKKEYPDVSVVAGTATAGIPHAAWVSDLLDLPMVYIRSGQKGHGKGNQIEGVLEKGQKVVLIEDLISTGGSSIAACNAILEAGAEVVAVLAIFSYNFPQAREKFESAGIPLHVLTDYETLLPIAVDKGYINLDSLDALRRWKDNPRLFTKD
ncbi:orotate phosphoribosyltransferase [Fusibacter tunisiensis]|uniref:Orotate phosphoribosyltransferase n=1 Tax=Fusibacter tunisiensis TaxID=1008308 RepID=A0ABS2MR69_9FIRM|nr:orotate phosphoribosyltransferase [Fusibacter tunisiensis]MBM7561888.1 orotate phosphoribosyltransferase [Fusibacter tunisiensis]